MDARLRKAAEEGNTNELYECIREDPNVLKRFDEYEFIDTPLHIAAAGGHADFAMAIMNLKPSFARKLNQDIYSPIHLALQNDHETTVLRLLDTDRELVRVKGKEGYTVLHQAAARGNLQLLAQFLKTCPATIGDVTIRNETALHIAAKNYRFEALQLLCRWLQRTHLYSKVSRKHLFNSSDKNGNTVLHIAAFPMQTQMIKILVECGADRMATNMYDMTALDIIKNQRINTQDRAISLKILRCGGGGFSCLRTCFNPRVQPLHKLLRSKISFCERLIMGSKLPLLSPVRINVLLVVLALILTATFQAVHNPPGGVWQGNPTDQSGNATAIIGSSVMSSENFITFMSLNLTVFAVTLIFTIALLHFAAAGSNIMILVQLILLSFTFCFIFAVLVVTPDSNVNAYPKELQSELGFTIIIWLIVIFIGMEMLRRVLSALPLRYQIFINYFREL